MVNLRIPLLAMEGKNLKILKASLSKYKFIISFEKYVMYNQ